DPFELPAGRPPARLATAVLTRLERPQALPQLALLGLAERRAVPDDVHLALAVVEAEDERAHALGLGAGPVPADHAVDRAPPPDLEHARSLARQIRGVDLLGDDALGGLQPALGSRGRRLLRCEPHRMAAGIGEQPLERGAPGAERLLHEVAVALCKQVER